MHGPQRIASVDQGQLSEALVERGVGIGMTAQGRQPTPGGTLQAVEAPALRQQRRHTDGEQLVSDRLRSALRQRDRIQRPARPASTLVWVQLVCDDGHAAAFRVQWMSLFA